MRRLTANRLSGEMTLTMVWKRLREIEDILGDDYDLVRLKHLAHGDTFTEEDMGASYMAGYQIGYEEGKKQARKNKEADLVAKAVNMAAANLAPVVRCKDCDVPHNKWTGCPNLNGMIPPADFYCARGERRRSDD